MALTKNNIVELIQNQLGFPKNQSREITESLLEVMKSDMAIEELEFKYAKMWERLGCSYQLPK